MSRGRRVPAVLGESAEAKPYKEPKERDEWGNEHLSARGRQCLEADARVTKCGAKGGRDGVRRKVQRDCRTIVRSEGRELTKIGHLCGFYASRFHKAALRRFKERACEVLANITNSLWKVAGRRPGVVRN